MSSSRPIPVVTVSPAGEDVMHVEPGSTPDGRLLLYFTFEKPAPPHQDEYRQAADPGL